MLNKMRMKLSEGFTLVEILVVLVIVAILAAIAFVSYSPIVDKGYAAEAEQYIKDVAGSTSIYEQTRGGRTPTLEELIEEGKIEPTEALMLNWDISISKKKITATSTEEMPGGAGETVEYDRTTSKFSGYGFGAGN